MAAKLTRREAREAALGLIYEKDFGACDDDGTLLALACENREIPENNKYINAVFFGVCEHMEEIDALIACHSVGWRTERLTRVSRAILRLAVYELKYMDDIPANVTINEAVELAKKYDDERAKPFINGILNAVKDELAGREAGEENK